MKKKGMSLIMVMVAAVVGAIIMAAVTQYFVSAFRTQKGIELETDYARFLRSIDFAVRTDDVCKIALEGETYQPGGVQDVSIDIYGKTYNAGATLDTGVKSDKLIVIDSVKIRDTGTPPQQVTITDDSGNLLTLNRFLGRLEIRATRQVTAPGGPTLQMKAIPLSVLADANNMIVQCHAELSPAQVCIESGGVYDESKPIEERCDLVDGTYGGCDVNGGYTIRDAGALCLVPHEDTGNCSCPSGTLRKQIEARFVAWGKYGTYIRYHNCIDCPGHPTENRHRSDCFNVGCGPTFEIPDLDVPDLDSGF